MRAIIHSIDRKLLGPTDRAEHLGDSPENILTILRELSPLEFGELLISLPDPRYPNLSRILPRMASARVQRDWTGADGAWLLNQTLAFTELLAGLGIDLGKARILDFGCGYGRIIRAIYYYASPDQIYGCDPWNKSIELCKEAGMLGHFALSDYLPSRLPFSGKFDLIYAYSVFTHLSERATRQCLNTLARAISPDGLIAITIRPQSYWRHSPDIKDWEVYAAKHSVDGFAFAPHILPPIDGDLTYGDTSMTTDWLEANLPSLKIVDTKCTSDPLQTLVVLRPRP